MKKEGIVYRSEGQPFRYQGWPTVIRDEDGNLLLSYGRREIPRGSRALEIKATLGVRITYAYKSGDMKALRDIVENILPELKSRVVTLHSRHRELWYGIYKPLGWEAEELRYGALLARIESVSYRLNQYLNGDISNLEELEQKRLTITGGEEMPRTVSYLKVVTPSYLDPGE